MPTKRQLADAAYERQEDQRALVVVLAAAMNVAHNLEDDDDRYDYRRELELAIERVKASVLRVAPVVKPDADTLPGQINIEGGVENVRQLGAPMAVAFEVPATCWKCERKMLDEQGTGWTPVRTPLGYQLQCGQCGASIEVREWTYDAVLAERRAAIGESDVKVSRIIAKAKRERGAR